MKYIVGILILLLTIIFATSIGSVPIDFDTILKSIVSKLQLWNFDEPINEITETVIWNIRLPRVILAAIVGASLGLSGATYQGVFRNPLADPYLIGVASGSGLAATIIFVSGLPLIIFNLNLLPIGTFIGGITAVMCAYMISKISQSRSITTIILAGVAIGAFASALSGILILKSDPDVRPLLSWLMGGFISGQWNKVIFLSPYLCFGSIIIYFYARSINILQLSDDHAASLGVNVRYIRFILIMASTLITASAVSFSGIIGFVGLASPHTVRLIWGEDYRKILPMSAIVGSIFLVVSDLISRIIMSPGELPVGVITALFGAPFFIYLLIYSGKKIK
jgi:iron complex transport system permease protein